MLIRDQQVKGELPWRWCNNYDKTIEAKRYFSYKNYKTVYQSLGSASLTRARASRIHLSIVYSPQNDTPYNL